LRTFESNRAMIWIMLRILLLVGFLGWAAIKRLSRAD
jgi:hypothetical protein